MGKLKITGKDLLEIGFKSGKSLGVTLDVVRKQYKNSHWDDVSPVLKSMISDPESYLNHNILGRAAQTLVVREVVSPITQINETPLDFHIYGLSEIENAAVEQLKLP